MRALWSLLLFAVALAPITASAQEQDEEETEETEEEEADEEEDATQQPAAQPQKRVAATKTSPKTGSLFNEKRTRMLVGMEGNARQIGDLITIEITESTSSQVSADTITRRDSSVSASIGSLFGIKQQIVDANPNMGGTIGMETESTNSFSGDGETSRAGKLDGKITCRVVEVRSNGNLVIFGWKEVRANRETMYLSLSGVIRPQDIQANNTILSDLIAEARIEYTGAGVISDKQGPGVGTRILDNIWPF